MVLLQYLHQQVLEVSLQIFSLEFFKISSTTIQIWWLLLSFSYLHYVRLNILFCLLDKDHVSLFVVMSVTPFINSLILMCIVFFFQGASGSCASMGKQIIKYFLVSQYMFLKSNKLLPIILIKNRNIFLLFAFLVFCIWNILRRYQSFNWNVGYSCCSSFKHGSFGLWIWCYFCKFTCSSVFK